MMCSMSSILLIVAAVVVLVAGDCIQDIRKTERDANGQPLMGSYRPIQNPENDTVVQKIVADSIKFYNDASNDMRLYADDDHYEAYSQLVNGENVCCGFQIESYAFKSGGNSDGCKQKKKLVCSVKAYKSFSDPYATIDRSTLNCTRVVKR